MIILTNNERIQKNEQFRKTKIRTRTTISNNTKTNKWWEILWIKNAINSTIKKINEVKKLYPFLKLETVDDCNDKKLFIREYPINSEYYAIEHNIDINNLEKGLSIIDDVINNPNKYQERINIANKLIEQLSDEHDSPRIYLIGGTISHDTREYIKITKGEVLEEIFINGEFNKENNLNLDIHIDYRTTDDLSGEYNIEMNGFKFKIETSIKTDGYDYLDANNDYSCSLENIKPEELTSLIKKLKETTRSHNFLLNFNKINR